MSWVKKTVRTCIASVKDELNSENWCIASVKDERSVCAWEAADNFCYMGKEKK